MRIVHEMDTQEALYSQALLDSLAREPLLVGDLPEAKAWREDLSEAPEGRSLNFSQKLGHLYEDAMERLIRHSSRWELLAKNLQVSDPESGRTLGELDFLIRDRETNEAIHLELAVKFYLAFESETGEVLFPGPDPRDNWLAKLERMRTHQLGMSRREAARGLLKKRFGVEACEVRQCVYGMIFDRIGADEPSKPPSVSEDCRRGDWLALNEWDRYYGDETEVLVIPKCLWPVRMNEELLGALEALEVDALKREASERCVMFWDRKKRRSVFLVDDRWPFL